MPNTFVRLSWQMWWLAKRLAALTGTEAGAWIIEARQAYEQQPIPFEAPAEVRT